MSSTSRPRRRLSAAALAFALAGGGAGMALSFAPAAYAASASVIDTTQPVSLAIHKHLGPAGAAGDGTVANPAPTGAALQGVNFDVYVVNGVDLSTNAGWTAATALQGRTLTPAEIAAGSFTVGATTYTITLVDTVTTDGTGTALFDTAAGASNGSLYVVAENLGTSGAITNVTTGDSVAAASLTPLPSFMVTLPMTNPAEDGWLYDVNVYPKNVADTITKAVTDQGSVAGGTPSTLRNISYALTSSIPDAIPAGQLGTYVVNDNLPDNVSLTSVTVELGTTTLVEGTDYDVYTGTDGEAMTAWNGTAVAGGPTVSIVFTQTGRDKLQADPSLDVVTTIGATVDSQTTTGVVTNTAQLIPSDSWWNNNKGSSTYDPNNPTTTGTTVPTSPVGVPSDPIESHYGDVTITKTDAETAALLDGAEFAVYSAGTDGACSAAEVDTTATVLATTAATTAGVVTVSGLQASDYYDGGVQTAIRGYCLVETQAPDGYNLLAQPVYFEVLDADGLGSGTPQALAVDNQKTNLGNSLPLTGGAGAAAISVGGLVLVGGGLAYYLVSSRRRDESESA